MKNLDRPRKRPEKRTCALNAPTTAPGFLFRNAGGFILDVTIFMMQAGYFYIATLSFIGSIAIGTLVLVVPAYFLFLFILGIALAVTARRYSSFSSSDAIFLLALGLVFSAVGLWRADLAVSQYAHSSLHAQVGQEVTLEGVVAREPDVRENNIQLFVEIADTKDVILVNVDRFSEVSYGDTLVVTGKLQLPEEFVSDYGRTFLYPQYLKAKGVQFRIAFADVEVLENGGGNPVITSLLVFKEAFVVRLGAVLSEPQSGLGVGLLLGVKQALGEELEQAFRKTGIIHIVVLSGYNVMLVVAFVLFVLGTFLPFALRAVFGIIAIVLFALLVGLSPTVVRASIMAVLVLLAPLLGRRYDLMRALLLAGCGMIFLNPYILLYDVGFQLSFLATLGLILVAPQFELLLMKAPNTLKAREFFIATLATQIAVSPLLLYQIGELSLVALVVNMLVLPMVGVAMLLTFITGILAFVSVDIASVVAVPAHVSLLYIIECARFFAGVPYASVAAPPFSVYWLFASYIFLGALWYMFTKKLKVKSSFTKIMPRLPAKEWEVIFEDELALGVQKQNTNKIAKQISEVSPKNNINEEPIFFR